MYSVRAGVQDVKKAAGVENASYSANNITAASITNGSAVHAISYDLLNAFGIEEDSLASLKSESGNIVVEANLNLAKGLQAEKNGNTVEALAYFQKVQDASSKKESQMHLNNITSVISGKNIRDEVYNDLKARKEWKKIWDDFLPYFNDNWAEIIYAPELIKLGKVDYKTETVSVKLPVAYRVSPSCLALYSRLLTAYGKVKKEGDWKLDATLRRIAAEGSVLTKTHFVITLSKEDGTVIQKKENEISFNLMDSGKDLGEPIRKAQFDRTVAWFELTNCDFKAFEDDVTVKITCDCKGAGIKAVKGRKK